MGLRRGDRIINLNGLTAFIMTMGPGLALASPVACSVGCGAAPAPLIGAGLPVALVVGAVLLGARLIKRFR
jgi:hypothetical protein